MASMRVCLAGALLVAATCIPLALAQGDEGGEGGEGGEPMIGLCGTDESASCRIAPFPAECEEEVCAKFVIFAFPLFALSMGLLTHVVISLGLKLPYTVLLMLVGCFWGSLFCGTDLGYLSDSAQLWVHLEPPEAFFYIFLAPLIFEAAFNTDWYVFSKLLVPIVTLAFPVVMIQVAVIAVFARLVFRAPSWTWWAAVMYGAMLSATDPISVTSTIKSVGASETLGTLIEGESLLNDGSAFVLWEAFFENVRFPGSMTIGQIVVDIIRLSLGGVAMGIAFGLVAVLLLSVFYEFLEVEVSITVVTAFLGFWAAQAPSRLSGVICNVFSGLVISALGKPLVTPETRGPMRHFWEILAWLANTFVFFYAGVLIVAFSWTCSSVSLRAVDFVYIIAWYAILQVLRLALVFAIQPLFRKLFSWRDALVVSMSGLRGAVSLILALEVAAESEIIPDISTRVVVWTCGVVFLSLLVNSLLIGPLIHALKLDRRPDVTEDFLWRAKGLMLQRIYEILDETAIKTTSKLARWDRIVQSVVPVEWVEDDRAAHGFGRASIELGNRHGRLPSENSHPDKSVHHIQRRSHNQRMRAVVGAVLPHGRQANAKKDDDYVNEYDQDPGNVLYHRKSVAHRVSLEFRDLRDVRAAIHNDLLVVGTRDVDVEIRRRYLLEMLRHVRAGYDTSITSFVTQQILQEDLKDALDANDHGRDYFLFAFLERPQDYLDLVGLSKLKFLRRVMRRIQIRSVSTILGIIPKVMHEPFMRESPAVLSEAESLFITATEVFTRLASVAARSIAFVETDAVIEHVFERQVEVAHHLRRTGSIGELDFKVLTEELTKLRERWYSPFNHARFRRRWPALTANQRLRNSALFSHLSDEEFEQVAAEGRMFTSESGAIIDYGEGGAVLVLEGSLKLTAGPCSAMREVQQREGNYHWCMPRHTVFVSGNAFEQNFPTGEHIEDEVAVCPVAGIATVFVVPRDLLRRLLATDEIFFLELLRSFGHMICLGIMADSRGLAGETPMFAVEVEDDSTGSSSSEERRHSNFMILNDRILTMFETLPYTQPVILETDEGKVNVQGPALLLQGSISAIPSSVGDPNYEVKFTAPALLPKGLLSISNDGNNTEAFLLALPFRGPHEVAIQRTRRWTTKSLVVNANGRFSPMVHLERPEISDWKPQSG